MSAPIAEARSVLARYLRTRRAFGRTRGDHTSPVFRAASLEYTRAYSDLTDFLWIEAEEVSGHIFLARINAGGGLSVQYMKGSRWEQRRSGWRSSAA